MPHNNPEMRELNADLNRLQKYARTLPEGDPERKEIEDEINEGKQVMARNNYSYDPDFDGDDDSNPLTDTDGDGGMPNNVDALRNQAAATNDSDSDSPDGVDGGIGDPELAALLAELEEAYGGEDDSAPVEPQVNAMPTASAAPDGPEQLQRYSHNPALVQTARNNIDNRLDSLVEQDRITPAFAEASKLMLYHMLGLPDRSGLMRYSRAEERADGVEAFLKALEGQKELGILNVYSRGDNNAGTDDEISISVPDGVTVNSDSAVRAAAIQRYARQHNLPYDKAMIKWGEEEARKARGG